MVEIDCDNVCDTTRRQSKKVGTGRYDIDELTKDIDCDVLFESSFLDGVYPKNAGKIQKYCFSRNQTIIVLWGRNLLVI